MPTFLRKLSPPERFFPGRNVHRTSIAVKGQRFEVNRIELATATYRKLGLNPRFFVPGIKVYTMDEANYGRFCRLAGLDPDQIGGFYPLARGGEEEAVTAGKLLKLSNQSRVVVLPEEFARITLLHELAHDIFLNGSILPAERNEIARLIVANTRQVLNTRPDSEEAKFIRKVASACQQRYNFEPIKELSLIPHEITREMLIFAGEMLAYGVEKKVTGDNKMGLIPKELATYLDHLQIKL